MHMPPAKLPGILLVSDDRGTIPVPSKLDVATNSVYLGVDEWISEFFSQVIVERA